MCLKMRAEIGAVGERALTVRTRKWLLASVGANVSLEEPRAGKRLSTKLALAGEGVSPDVHLQCAQGHVFLVAVLAVECLLVLRVAVELPVLAKPTKRRVLLPAVRAVILGAILALVSTSLLQFPLGFAR